MIMAKPLLILTALAGLAVLAWSKGNMESRCTATSSTLTVGVGARNILVIVTEQDLKFYLW